MYMTDIRIYSALLSEDEYMSIVYFIKQELPHLNPYDILKRGNFNSVNFITNYSFRILCMNKLDDIVIIDLLQCIGSHLLQTGMLHIDKLHVLNAIIMHYDKYKEIIFSQINNQVIRNMLQQYTLSAQSCYKYYEHKMVNVFFPI